MTIVTDVAADLAELSQRAATYICDTLSAQSELLAVCLSGGETPKPLYEALTRDPFRERMPWGRIHWFMGDERFVPRDDARSNYRMINEALFSKAPIPAANIHPMTTEGVSLEAAADAYERLLKEHYGSDALAKDRALFDIAIMGLGPDGHTASLFPGSPVLDERARWVQGVRTPSQPEPRLTLTYPVLEASRSLVFLVAGADKRAMLARLVKSDDTIPAGRLRADGVIHAFVDSAAAGSPAS